MPAHHCVLCETAPKNVCPHWHAIATSERREGHRSSLRPSSTPQPPQQARTANQALSHASVNLQADSRANAPMKQFVGPKVRQRVGFQATGIWALRFCHAKKGLRGPPAIPLKSTMAISEAHLRSPHKTSQNQRSHVTAGLKNARTENNRKLYKQISTPKNG